MNGGQANFLQSLGWAVLNSLWQLALLWVVYQLIIGVYKKATASLKSGLATTLLIIGFGWFLFTFISIFSLNAEGSQAIASSPLVNADANPELNNWLQRTLPLASITYLVLLVFPVLHFIRNYRYVQVIRKFGLTRIDPNWKIFVQRIGERLGIKKTVRVWVSEFVSSPVTIGFFKPVILVPLAAINHLTPQQVEAILLHELSHIRRYDYLLNIIIHFIQAILYFNPFAKAFVKIVEKEREKSCDEMVLQFQYDSHEYASALLTLEKNSQVKPLAVSAAGKKNDLLTRIEVILGVRKNKTVSFNKLAGFMAGLLCIIAVNALLLLTMPASMDRAVAFPRLSSLTHSTGGQQAKVNTANAEQSVATIINHNIPANREVEYEPATTKKEISSTPSGMFASAFQSPGFINVDYTTVPDAPVLKKYQEEQVKEVLENSKKVIENKQWKAVEKSIADVFTEKEKQKLKESYLKQFEKFDWKQWETKLTLAYNNVDWEKVNSQLSSAVNEVRIDSIQNVYAIAMAKIDEAHKELVENNLSGIPDSDITLKQLEIKRAEVVKALSNLKALKSKKVVHL